MRFYNRYKSTMEETHEGTDRVKTRASSTVLATWKRFSASNIENKILIKTNF